MGQELDGKGDVPLIGERAKRTYISYEFESAK